MPLEHIQPVLENFISDSHSELIVLKGKWGVGKTFFWQTLIREGRAKRNVGRHWYSYVSLFGVNSLEDLKNSIMASRMEANASRWKTRVQERTASLKQLAKGLEKTKLGSYTGGLASEYLYQLLDDSLICFDDLERKGDGLKFKDIFGLAAVLKEQRRCKVLLIMNDESLQESDREEFSLHGEKLIDREIRFAIDAEEAFSNIFEPTFRWNDVIKRSCITLHVKNMRILQRVKRYVEDVLPLLRGSENKLVEEVLGSLVLFVWSYYDKEGEAPPLEFIKGFSLAAKYIRGKYKKEEETAETKRWDEVLGSYNYLSTNAIDERLIDFVTSGYLDKLSFAKELNERNQHFRILKLDANYNEVWALFRNSFKNNEEQFLNELVTRFRANMKVLSVSELESAVGTLRTFERNDLANCLIDEYFGTFDTPKDLETFRLLQRTMFDTDRLDEYLMIRLKAIWASEEADSRSLGAVFKENLLKEDWDFSDVRRIESFSVDDYYDFFKSEDSSDLYYYVRKCLDFERLTDEKGIHKSISDKTKQALERIRFESRINRIRLSSLYKLDTNT